MKKVNTPLVEQKFYLKRARGFNVGRRVIISSDIISSNKEQRHSGINITITWDKDDRRYERILSGECMEQNFIADEVSLLKGLQICFPELDIKFNER